MKISVASIQKPRGFRGELAVIPYKLDSQSLKPGGIVTLQKGDSSQDYTIQTVAFYSGKISLKLDGIDSEEAAAYWRGGDILMEIEKLESLEKGEYYHFQIEGCEVYEDNGLHVGKVLSIDTYTANDILTVKNESGEILIPFIKLVIQSIDIENKKIIIRKIEGLY